MPPNIKITEEAILETAFALVRTEGSSSLHARAVAKQLGCSVQPIFMNFRTMESLRAEVYKKAELLFNTSLEQGLGKHAIPFLGMGLAYCDFAKTEKQLFRLLFMSDEFHQRNILDLVQAEDNQANIALVAQMAGLDQKQAQTVFLDIWLLVHGIASMLATNDCELSEETIEHLLKQTFTALIRHKEHL